jgi:hypothetical protein
MTRGLAVVVLLLAVASFVKLAGKRPDFSRIWPNPSTTTEATTPAEAPTSPDPGAALAQRYAGASEADRALVARTLERFRQNAVRVEATDGLRGLALLDRLDLEALDLYENQPALFQKLRDLVGDAAAAELLGHWSEYFGQKRGDTTDREILVREIAGLPPSALRAGAIYPAALPLLLASPSEVTGWIEAHREDPASLGESLALLHLVSLEQGPAALRDAIACLDARLNLSLQAFRRFGPEGFALARRFGPLLDELDGSVELDRSIALLWANHEDAAELLKTHSASSLARQIHHLDRTGLLEMAGSTPRGLRFAIELGYEGELALDRAGCDSADVIYASYTDPAVRRPAVQALGHYGELALVTLEKYADEADFRAILARDGAEIVPFVARSDEALRALGALEAKSDKNIGEQLAYAVLAVSGESGQATIRLIQKDGLARAREVQSTELSFAQFLPTYDLVHLGHVVSRGQAPTVGESAWALVDAAFLVADALSLLTLQPEGVAAVEAARNGAKSAVRGTARSAGRDAVEKAIANATKAAGRETAEAATRQAGRWWAVRSLGGPFPMILRRPEALERLSLSRLLDDAGPFCRKLGFSPSRLKPVSVARNGKIITHYIPPSLRLPSLATQAMAGQVTVVGWSKMEEFLASRRGSAIPGIDSVQGSDSNSRISPVSHPAHGAPASETSVTP